LLVSYLALSSYLQATLDMATPVILGVGAIAAAIAGRSLLQRAGKKAAEEWVKGGFKAKMDRKEAIAILGLKYESQNCW
jgi:DnaJ homolog subfamily C member 19